MHFLVLSKFLKMSVAATRWCWKHGKQKQHLFSTLWKTGDGKRVPYKYVHPFLDTGAHVYRGPVFHHLFTILTTGTGAHVYRGPVFHILFSTFAPVYHICTRFPPFAPIFYLETVYTHTQTSGNVLSKSGVRLALAAPV